MGFYQALFRTSFFYPPPPHTHTTCISLVDFWVFIFQSEREFIDVRRKSEVFHGELPDDRIMQDLCKNKPLATRGFGQRKRNRNTPFGRKTN